MVVEVNAPGKNKRSWPNPKNYGRCNTPGKKL